jgi:hypothetical protein
VLPLDRHKDEKLLQRHLAHSTRSTKGEGSKRSSARPKVRLSRLGHTYHHEKLCRPAGAGWPLLGEPCGSGSTIARLQTMSR